MLLQYAWKGFWRRRTRSMLAIIGIVLSVGLLVAVVTITRSVEQAVASSLDAAGADMVIQKRVKACPFSIIKLPKDLATIPSDVVTQLADDEAVEEATGVLELWAFHIDESAAPSAGGSDLGFPKPGGGAMQEDSQGLPMIGGKALQPTVVAGIDPSKKTIGPVRIATREEVGEDETCCAVTKGRYLVPNDDYHAMITEDYAKAKGLTVGDYIPLGLEHKFEVVALLDVSASARIAGAEAFIPLATAQELLGQGDVVDTIFVSLAHAGGTERVGALASRLIGENVSITTESDVDAGTAALASVTRHSLLAISGFVLFFALLILVRNAMDNVAQRVDEVGLMKAIGWRNADVARLFVVEAVYAALIGGVIGSVLGSVAGWAYGRMAELELPASLTSFPPCSTTPAPLALRLSTDPQPSVFLLGLGMALLIGAIAGLAASSRAAKLDPVDALRRL
ncbi:MAG: ABC transporter permease [Armatimonadetes bacterium]|jgi:putative ABC transport system permease protein|nr:ABC transporter permease [Armatimonadota bacterium]